MTIEHEGTVVFRETHVKPKGHIITNIVLPLALGYPRIREIILIPDRADPHNDTVEIVESDGYSIELRSKEINDMAFCRKNGIVWRGVGEM